MPICGSCHTRVLLNLLHHSEYVDLLHIIMTSFWKIIARSNNTSDGAFTCCWEALKFEGWLLVGNTNCFACMCVLFRCLSQCPSVRDHLCQRGRGGEWQQTKRRWQLEKDQRKRGKGLQAGLHR